MNDALAQSAPLTIESAVRSHAIALSFSKNDQEGKEGDIPIKKPRR
jgi:hypothetical protein